MPSWSHDGQRIAFHATPQNDWQKAEMFALRDAGQKPVLQPLGAGSCPAYSPDDHSIAFLVWPGAKAGVEAGVHQMLSDGTDRRRIGGIGAPYWSPDGKRLLINPFTEPTVSTILDLPTGRQDLVQVPGYQLVSWPRWIAKDRVVAVVHQGDSLCEAELVVLDVRQPSRASIVESLWKRTPELDVLPRWPIYRSSADEYLFVGVREPFDRNLFRLAPRREAFPTATQSRFHPDQLEGLVLSPGDRYLVFNANRPDRMPSELNPGVKR